MLALLPRPALSTADLCYAATRSLSFRQRGTSMRCLRAPGTFLRPRYAMSGTGIARRVLRTRLLRGTEFGMGRCRAVNVAYCGR
eukprot:2236118-Rhodomonas_salina.1